MTLQKRKNSVTHRWVIIHTICQVPKGKLFLLLLLYSLIHSSFFILTITYVIYLFNYIKLTWEIHSQVNILNSDYFVIAILNCVAENCIHTQATKLDDIWMSKMSLKIFTKNRFLSSKNKTTHALFMVSPNAHTHIYTIIHTIFHVRCADL